MPKLMKESLVTCTFPAANRYGQLGWGLAVGSQGELAAMIVAGETRWVWNHSPIVDCQWHHLAMTFDGTDLMLYVDGQHSKQDETLTSPAELPPTPGLLIGSQGTIVCEALVQEIRLSSGLRVPEKIDDRLAADQQTLAIWRLDNDGRMTDVTGNCPSGVITAFERESLDEFERKQYHAGPAPLDLPAQEVELISGDEDHVEGPAILSLDGRWQMVEGGDDASRLAGQWKDTVAADVPGSVHAALENAGKIPDPKFGLNEAIAREISFKTWWLRKTFSRPPGIGHRLIFDGVAIHCTVWLNGVKLGEHEGMFGGPDFDVAGLLKDENDLIVKLDPAPIWASMVCRNRQHRMEKNGRVQQRLRLALFAHPGIGNLEKRSGGKCAGLEIATSVRGHSRCRRGQRQASAWTSRRCAAAGGDR